MDIPAPEASFGCAVCGNVAGRVRLAGPAEPLGDKSRPALEALAGLDALVRPHGQARVVVQTFFGVATQPLSADRADAVAEAIAGANASALYRVGYAYAPFHCPDCAASYCGEHWNWREFDDDPFSGIEGDCPRGHFHVLAY
ncbi:hypothetical protein [Mycobacterium persicum]|uniref:Uncharacterized protein n=1 Tax=Mycobacterium persicum TaxID=1487726 RepID=A0AB38UUY1_9MYCO|nr:hypothetical protein [Mycobacterium persicum]VAZ84081.1 hypothetical protein LAUMK42_02900 [Mycobacterium persicum]